MDVLVEGLGPCTVVAVHGIQGTRGSWRPVVQRLAEVRWVLPNLRGRGTAWRGAGPLDYTLDRFAAELAEVVRLHVPEGPYVLAGWSLGASISVEALASGRLRRPEGLLLVSGSPVLQQTRWFEGDHAALARSVIARRQRWGLQDHADDVAVQHTWQAVRHSDQRAVLARLAVPAVVMHGRDDDDCPPAHAAWLSQGLGAACHLLNGVGHGVLSQAPDAVAAQLAVLCRVPAPPVS